MGKAVGFDEFEGMFDEGDVDVLSLLDASAARPASREPITTGTPA